MCVRACVRACVLRSLGDMKSILGLPRILTFETKRTLGIVPDFRGENESTANTSLEYHAGGEQRKQETANI